MVARNAPLVRGLENNQNQRATKKGIAMMGMELLITNLMSPLVLAFLLGVIATLVKSELAFPEGVLKFMSVYLLFAIGLKGGHELSQVSFADISGALMITIALVVFIPAFCFVILKHLGRLSIENAAGVAAHYGSVSSVTFFAALAFAKAMNAPPEGFMPALVALMEWGVVVALFIARWQLARVNGANVPVKNIVLETLRGRGIILLSGGLTIGWIVGDTGFSQVAPFYDGIFRGILMLFLLEMGMTAARQLSEFAKVGWFMTGFGILMPIINGVIGVTLAYYIGLSMGGAFVFGAIAASASYIDAPAAVRSALPAANPSIYLTTSLGITFPFNLLIGLPLYFEYAQWLFG
jgi:uncharacterized protein